MHVRRGVVEVVVLLVLAGCGRTEVIGGDPPPVAVIDVTPSRGTTGEVIVFDGTRSEDPLGEPLSYAWRIVEAPASATRNLENVSAARAQLRPDLGGTWRVELVVTAGLRRSEPVRASIAVAQGMSLVLAHAGPDRQGFIGDRVVLDGSLSRDPAGATLSYRWTLTTPTGSSAMLAAATTVSPSFVADRAGTYVAKLVVSTPGGTDADEARIVVVDRNRPPVAELGPIVDPVVGRTLVLDGSSSRDPEGGMLTFTWRVLTWPSGLEVMLANANSPQPSFVPSQPGNHTVELTVRDPGGLSSAESTSFTVRAAVDAGTPDAGRPDAGLPDASITTDGGGFDVLDPTAVYLDGTLSPGSCGADALMNLGAPAIVTTGFGCYFEERTAVIRPTDGRLLYVNVFEDQLRAYHCDACPYMGTYSPSGMPVLANDPVLPQACPNNADLNGFMVSPEGDVIHTCRLEPVGVWRDPVGTLVYDAGTDGVRWLGANGWLLAGTRVVNLRTGETHPLVGLPQGTALTIRWNPPDGFWLALNAGQNGAELWRVAVGTGLAQRVGTYPAFPTGHTVAAGAKLNGSGALYRFARGPNVLHDAVVRCELGGTCDVVHTEATNPLVKIHISGLITGP